MYIIITIICSEVDEEIMHIVYLHIFSGESEQLCNELQTFTMQYIWKLTVW